MSDVKARVLLSVDQSMSGSAWTLWINDKPTIKGLIRTGSTQSKAKRRSDTRYFETIVEQLEHICVSLMRVVKNHEVTDLVIEGVSQGSYGSAKGYLVTLHRAINDYARVAGLPSVAEIAPTSVKAYARQFLEVQRTSDKKLVKMDKKKMVEACRAVAPDGWLESLSKSDGVEDYADSFLIGHKYIKDN